jgi:transcriptional regulator with XRE-family HTH domain
MKQCKVYECKRRALGLTQKDVADMAGVSSSTIANFEAGNEVSIPVFRAIKGVIDNHFKTLDEQQYAECKLLQYALQLSEEREDKKLKTAAYISMFASRLSLALINQQERVEAE